jgi:hypothetical protein
MWHSLPDLVGPSPANGFNLGDYATKDNGFPSPPNFRALALVAIGAASPRVGDVVSSSRGLAIPAVATVGGSPTILPYVGEAAINALSGVNLYVPAGTTVTIAFEY